ncbi:MAG TPA: CHAT domain-containing protein, partial [Polyangiales bacterium]|nr:CHAT domain-containing protein [Polyangiales bacterium]
MLQNIALVQYELGRVSQIHQTYARVMSLLKESDAPRLYADVLNNMAVEEADEGNFDAALRHYSEALQIFTRLQSAREQARSLQGIGAVYYAVGSRSQALDYFSRALEIRTVQVDPRGRLGTLRSIANVMADSKRWSEALARREEALTLAVSPVQEARLKVEIAVNTAEAGRPDEAWGLIERVVVSSPSSNPVVMGRALMARAQLARARKDFDAATRDTASAGAIFRSRGMPGAQFGATLLAAQVAQDAGRVDVARTKVDEALTLAEHVRTLSANPELRAGLWHPLRPAFDLKIELLRDQLASGPSPSLEMLSVAERSRDRALADFQARLAAVRTDASRRVEDRQRGLYRDIAERRLLLEARLDRIGDDDARSRAIRADIDSLSRELDISRGMTRSEQSASSDRSVQALRDLLSSVPADTTVVEYWLGEKNAYAWTLQQGTRSMVELGSTATIERVAREFHASLSNFATVPQDVRLRLARELYRLLIEPLPAKAIKSRTLLFVPDGALHYVPFAALCADENVPRFLTDDHDVALGSSVFALLAARAPEKSSPPKRDLLIVSDPVYSNDDAGVTPAWSRLRSSAREAAAITALFPASAVDKLSAAAATREALLAKNLSGYRIVHVAAHGVANVESPQLSALVLSTVDTEGRRVAGEVFAGDLLQHPLGADLVVLSACETALGKEASGEGLLGLRYVA